jgi:hypothetical protein
MNVLFASGFSTIATFGTYKAIIFGHTRCLAKHRGETTD